MFKITIKKILLMVFLMAGFSEIALSAALGDELTALSIKAMPANLDYKPNGKNQFILVYPLKFSSRKVKTFHRRVLAAGYCPMSIVDMNNRGWYAPLSLAEAEIAKEMKESLNPKCTVTADYNSKANNQWGLNEGPVSIVVNGEGNVVFIVYGILSEKQEEQVLALLAAESADKVALN